MHDTVTDSGRGPSAITIPACDPDTWFPCQAIPASADSLTCYHMSLAGLLPRHEHEFHLVAFILAGNGLHEDISGCFPVLPGDVCVVPAGQHHGYPHVHRRLSVFNLAFSRAYLADRAPLLGNSAAPRALFGDPSAAAQVPQSTLLRLALSGLRRIVPLLLALADELEDPRSLVEPGVSTGLLLQILGILSRTRHDHRGASLDDGRAADSPVHSSIGTTGDAPSLDYLRSVVGHPVWVGHLREGNVQSDGQVGDASVLAAVQYLGEHHAEPLSIEGLARYTGYTPTYLARKFRQQLGLSPSAYLLRVRLQHACTLLLTTNEPITSIARETGFHDSQHFAKRFRQELGTTPSTFRTRTRTESDPKGTEIDKPRSGGRWKPGNRGSRSPDKT